MKRSIVHLVATNNFAGVERYISYVAPLQAAADWKVTVIGGDPTRMRNALGNTVHHIPAASLAAASWQTSRLGHVDVVHAHMTTAEFAGMVAWPVGRPRLIATRHFASRRGSSTASRLAGRLIGRTYSAQIAISQFVADSIHEPSVVIPNGVPNAEVAADPIRQVLVAQRMEAEKDSDVAIDAWARSGLAADGWTLAFAGRGSQEAHLRARARELAVDQSVRFLGFVDDLSRELERSRIFLATALAEPFGLSVVEAMAHGVPVVASAAGAHRETVGSVAPELLFEPGDVEGCSELLRQVAAGSADWGRQLQARQRSEFSLNGHVAHLLAIYDRVLAGENVVR